jgi:hypothetical protein
VTVFQPNITHLPCDLSQQQERADARRDSLARAVAWRMGHRSLLDRLLRRGAPALDLSARDLLGCGPEQDVFHSFGV